MSEHHKKISKNDRLMDKIRPITRTSKKMIIFIVIALITSLCPAFCAEIQLDISKEFNETQYKNHIKEFQRAFGKQIEEEFGLKWVEGGFTHKFFSDKPEFYAYRRATLEEARALVLAVIFRLSEAVHADPIMLSYFNKSSLNPDVLGVDISFLHSPNWSYDDGSIESVYSYYSKEDASGVKKLHLRYAATDPFSDISDFKNIVYSKIEESFEDAVKLNAVNPIINPAIHHPKEFEDELHRILTSFEKEMKEKYNLFFRSIGWMVAGDAPSEISEIRTKCTYFYPVDCEEARALILLATEKLLASLNNNETLKPYLKDYPFSANGIKLRMLFRKKNYFVGDVPYYDESMESVVLSDDTITYYHHIPSAEDSNMHDRVLYAKELYQEAQNTFKNTPPLTLFKKAATGIKNFIFDSIHFLELAGIYVFYSFWYSIVYFTSET
ncbi:hypothetical protein [Criblamydia sequanensis]|uniref:Membrane protein n=1 Tax=Candidatus Criblamydia sequanensis CRIB-18 TaxID=1437425 RepID=A0A090D225_9BACT|nr:hypothetical protein [Criblamydia sequanensis]CDR34240.1 putative membrane protein [Criblamydia sequanensis CRIB-18]